MSLQSEKSALEGKVTRYITLLSNLQTPPVDFIGHMHYFKGLVQFANTKEIEGLQALWREIAPTDGRSLAYIDKGIVTDNDGALALTAVERAILGLQVLRGGPTSGNYGHKGRPGKHGGSVAGGGHKAIGLKGKPKSRKEVMAAREKHRAKSTGGGAGGGAKIPVKIGGQFIEKHVTAADINRMVDYNDGSVVLAIEGRQKVFLERAGNGGLVVSGRDGGPVTAGYVAGKVNEATGFKPAPPKAAKKGTKPKDIKEAQSIIDKAQAERDKNLGLGNTPAGKKKVVALRKEMGDLENELYDKLEKDMRDAIIADDGSRASSVRINNAEMALIKNRSRTREILDELDEVQGGRVNKESWNKYINDTEAAHETLFNHNLKKAKEVRAGIIKAHASKQAADDDLRFMNSELEAIGKERKRLKEKGIRPGSKEWDATETKERSIMQQMSGDNGTIDRFNKAARAADVETNDLLGVGKNRRTQVEIDYLQDHFSDQIKNREKGTADFEMLVDRSVYPAGTRVGYDITPTGRAYHQGTNIYLKVSEYGSATVIHELGHDVEGANPRVGRKARAFLEQRTKGEAARKLSDITGNTNYRDDEIARPDKFLNPYMGKRYAGGLTPPTEIISMGLEYMHARPVEFAQKDPEYFDFIYAISRSG